MARVQSTREGRTRRGFLRTAAGVGGGIATAGVAAVLDGTAAAASGSDAAAILDQAATAEALAVTVYCAALTAATFHVDDQAREHLRSTMDDEMRHLRALRSLGAVPGQQRFHLPGRMLADAHAFALAALRLERAIADAYLAATQRLAVLGQPRLVALAARHAASEAQHLALVGHLAGLGPRDLAHLAGLQQPTDRSAALAPFLSGGAGFSAAARFPTVSQYRAAGGEG